MNATRVDTTFRADVLEGLSASPKYLLPKYFYDELGDELFQQIMHCPEYYLTRAEAEILMFQSRFILEGCADLQDPFDIVELGAGDGSKTKYLLEEALKMGYRGTYYPIDISPNILDYLRRKLAVNLPSLTVEGLAGDYFTMLEQLQAVNEKPKLVLFMGASIGNMFPQQALTFLQQVSTFLRLGDYLLVGFDLKKNPQTILEAYNDKGGLTKAFNLNLLHRINRELGTNFKPESFRHFPVYDPLSGSCKSYLISTCSQRVMLDDGTMIEFEPHEPIFMEVSQKYSPEETDEMAIKAGFEPVNTFYDGRHHFMDSLWRVPGRS